MFCQKVCTRCAILDCGIQPGANTQRAPNFCCNSTARRRPAPMQNQPRQRCKRLSRSVTIDGSTGASALAARSRASFASPSSTHDKRGAHETSRQVYDCCPVRWLRHATGTLAPRTVLHRCRVPKNSAHRNNYAVRSLKYDPFWDHQFSMSAANRFPFRSPQLKIP